MVIRQIHMRRGGYGLIYVTVRRDDGEEFTATGITENQALYRAGLRAKVAVQRDQETQNG